MTKTNWLRWVEAIAPSAQMFHGLGKGLGRGRGPRLAKAPTSEVLKEGQDREKDFSRAA